jgi:hypothetical protein
MRAREVIADTLKFDGNPSFSFPPGPMKTASEHVADYLIEALESAGWVLVPIEPSEKMIEAGCREQCRIEGVNPDQDWRDCGAVMLSVALKPGHEQRWRTYDREVLAAYSAMLKAAKDEDSQQPLERRGE